MNQTQQSKSCWARNAIDLAAPKFLERSTALEALKARSGFTSLAFPESEKANPQIRFF